jgi:hypothetical protein
VIDIDEFEYTMEQFKVPGAGARKAFKLLTQVGGHIQFDLISIFQGEENARIDYDHFFTLACQYFFADDQSLPGNFLAGKLDFEHGGADEKKKPGFFGLI